MHKKNTSKDCDNRDNNNNNNNNNDINNNQLNILGLLNNVNLINSVVTFSQVPNHENVLEFNSAIERFSIECRKTKTKVITTAN